MRLSKREGGGLAALISLFLVFSLLMRESVRRLLLAGNATGDGAADLAVVAGIVILALTAWPLCLRYRLSPAVFFLRPKSLPRTLLIGIAGGVLCRLLDWLHLVSGNPGDHSAVAVSLDCSMPAAGATALATVAIPTVEEIAHRGLLLAGLMPYGTVPAVLGSAIVFAILHDSFVAPFAFGLVAASMAIRSGSLWLPLIAHATFNLLNVLEAACLNVQSTSPGGELIESATAAIVSLPLIGMLCWLTYIAASEPKAVPMRHTPAN